MTAELVRGQNHTLPQTRLEIRVSAGTPVVAGATLGDERGTVHGIEWIAHPGSPQLPGLEVSRQAAADHRLAVDLDAMPAAVHRVTVLLALPMEAGGPVRFGAVAAPFVAVTGLEGTEIATFTLTGLDAESAVAALELYRRQGDWKVRAVGQGYAGGLAAMLADQGVTGAAELARSIHEAVARGMARSVAPPPPRTPEGDRVRHTAAIGDPARPVGPPAGPAPSRPTAATDSTAGGPTAGASTGPINYAHPRRQATAPPPPPPTAPPSEPGRPAQPVAGDATGWSMEERLYNQVWGMFEDLARTTAAYRSAVDFAESRMDQELDRALSDPRNRIGGAGDRAREEARAKRDQLTDRAREALDRDLAQLAAESAVVEPALPAAFAGWDNPVWHAYRVPMEIPMAVRIGDLHLPENSDLRIPLLVRLPLERGIWVDSGRTASEAAALTDTDRLRRLAMDNAVAHAARLLAVYPAGEFSVHVIDPAGSAAAALAPLVNSGVLAGPPASGAGGVASVLAHLTRRVDLVQMAIRAGAADSLPPELDTAEQLLIVNDFPHGFDDRAVTQLRYLADEGPSVGVHLLMVADREDASAYGPVLDPLWRSLLRITPVADDHLADPWVGHAWTYEPLRTPPGSRVLEQVLAQVAAARRSGRRP
ncbi:MULTISPECIES: TerD family protein [unclassified Streptomyces]|uniref:TerD family protein n=1 Tax=unclassified Streptomyces TaxID=2593676 RepID=UPI002DDB2417|nr:MULTISPECIES: TerD family protein [unclassified Streptomyces]WSF87401.1 TerD family protein [Streptomyces sp. NBC_01744]WSC36357.1 TerD family protein [Streptomyces sp. NBC_01763]WSC44456.1 TerD family protein [Streptomyces sp. NBC_01762]WSC56562.1 TerD family protein [Streptomyces sp. NBC_01761]WSD24043.1 TerD family protein [Streptomyces sp. NBC_01751]